ncbi:ABC-type hemin transport system ATPase subunit [Crossiella equi]|uniref:ABC-type hemin transport system ATPase subunit n=2 Tax=Crossiella equi TaxID=130796 RepID=A0ABS5AMV9_9PSEU|nr:ATP-binding cassette domain-containing protein [Crossiella equi]MBP2477923.1 ABC-type hemin transport system ATPase subunit [Crossiella equi]
MEILARDVGVNGAHGPLLRPTSLSVKPGQVALVAGEPGSGHTPLALALAGRLKPTAGEVTVDGRADDAALRRLVAVVDAPGVTDPEDALPLKIVVGEELSYARKPARRAAVAEWLRTHDAQQYADTRVDLVPPTVRTRLLTELAAERPDVRVLVLDCPDRHCDDPHTWWSVARAHATRDRAVVVLCTETSVRLLDLPAARLGRQQQPPAFTIAPDPAPQDFSEDETR